ncbi:hypothetical protein RHMOL_Rhmol05G0289700 [Rhododendron molle]|uniref:Uncharacterized protein n=1 Tax=Rhododendron molle TaxID=49168 RepID=A0ACC0NWI3_RHOML|nr:hypothetical protein RHMOL_Rhmol05G0289700 [Rhododendron molle]
MEIHPTEMSQGENDCEEDIQCLTSTISAKLHEGAQKAESLFSSACIYRVPEELRKLNASAYTPRLIAIGPLHRNDKQGWSQGGATGRGRVRKDNIDFGHHFRVEVFTYTIDSQWNELNNRFKEDTMELLVLNTSLDPRDGFRSFKIEDACKLAEKYYPMDFTEHEKQHLKYQLQNYKLDVPNHMEFQNLSTISKLSEVLVKTRKSMIYPLIDRLIRLILILPVSTATTERAFSAMKCVKTRLRNRMEDELLASFLITYIEKDIARGFDTDSIIDAFNDMKERRVQFKMPRFTR